MKALIVDDEKHVRDAIRLLSDWEGNGITEVLEASDGEAAAEAIREHAPQIVMTDMKMPRKDGVQLLTWIRDNAPECKALVISGYDDFELIRHTIRSGGVDYILKPVEPEALNEALARAVNAWRSDEEKRAAQIRQSIEVNEMKPHYADKLLSELVAGHGGTERAVGLLRGQAGMPETAGEAQVGLISLEQLDAGLLGKFQRDRQLLAFMVLNICNELLKNKGTAFQHLNRYGEIVLLYWDRQVPFRAVFDRINEGFELALRRRLHAGLSGFLPFPDGAGKAYKEARAALWRRNLLESGERLHAAAAGEQPARFPRLSGRADKLRLAALGGKDEQMAAAADEWLEEMKQQPSVTPENIAEWNDEWDWLQKQWEDGNEGRAAEAANEETPETENGAYPLPLDSEGLLSWPLWREMMLGRLKAASRLLAALHTKDNHIIHDIARYVEAHYREEVSLQDIASHFFLSREYISRKFKQEFGVTMSDFLSRIRIDKAKVLLRNTPLRISQIAESVGYRDENYFSKVFKKQEGVRPGEYRKQFSGEG